MHQDGKGHIPEDTTCDRATVSKGAIHVETVAIVSDSAGIAVTIFTTQVNDLFTDQYPIISVLLFV